MLASCEKNEPKKDEPFMQEEESASFEVTTSNNTPNPSPGDTSTAETDSGWEAAINRQLTHSAVSKSPQQSNGSSLPISTTEEVAAKKSPADFTANSPLRILLKNAEVGKSYSKKELIEKYKFPKEAVDLIKKVTCVGPNKLYFNWGSTWLVEKVSDAEFENDTLIFSFKKNKTYVSGGAIGIKYNKKIHTELILNNGSAYIPTVKGYHWEIAK